MYSINMRREFTDGLSIYSRSCLNGSRSMRSLNVSWRALRKKPGLWALSSSNWRTPMRSLLIIWRPWRERTKTCRVKSTSRIVVSRQIYCKAILTKLSDIPQRRYLTSLSNLVRVGRASTNWRNCGNNWNRRRTRSSLLSRKLRYRTSSLSNTFYSSNVCWFVNLSAPSYPPGLPWAWGG